jgi:hypothetical protein
MILPLRTSFKSHQCFSIGDKVNIGLIANLANKVRGTTDKCVSIFEIDSRFRNEAKLLQYLSSSDIAGYVFAVFKNHILLELDPNLYQFHLCNKGN